MRADPPGVVALVVRGEASDTPIWFVDTDHASAPGVGHLETSPDLALCQDIGGSGLWGIPDPTVAVEKTLLICEGCTGLTVHPQGSGHVPEAADEVRVGEYVCPPFTAQDHHPVGRV